MHAFQKGKGTLQAVLKIRSILERAVWERKEVHMVTIDISKAYDSVRYREIEETMVEYGVPRNVRDIIMKAHDERRIRFLTGFGNTEGSTPSCA